MHKHKGACPTYIRLYQNQRPPATKKGSNVKIKILLSIVCLLLFGCGTAPVDLWASTKSALSDMMPRKSVDYGIPTLDEAVAIEFIARLDQKEQSGTKGNEEVVISSKDGINRYTFVPAGDGPKNRLYRVYKLDTRDVAQVKIPMGVGNFIRPVSFEPKLASTTTTIQTPNSHQVVSGNPLEYNNERWPPRDMMLPKTIVHDPSPSPFLKVSQNLKKPAQKSKKSSKKKNKRQLETWDRPDIPPKRM